MRRFLRITALVLLAVWLPVTKHCMLEAAGVLDVTSESADASGCCVDPDPCADDNCEMVEQGLTASSSASVKVPTAQLFAVVDFLCDAADAACDEVGQSSRLSDALDQPLDWVPAWHFEHRAALPSRAPSFAST